MANPKVVQWSVTPDGAHHCTLEFRTFVYDPDGTLVNTQVNGIAASMSPQKFAALGDLQYLQQISVPAKGEYYLRIGIRDDTSYHIGALELPVAAAAKLPAVAMPLPAPPAHQK
jgi:hypothetical protein